MADYEKPMLRVNVELAEGVYLASGDTTSDSSGSLSCDSVYMKGVWQAPDYSDWAGGTRGYKQQFGCLGCPAYTATACGLLTHYADSDYASSYEVDNGNRKPSWEAKGYGPEDTVTDWNM